MKWKIVADSSCDLKSVDLNFDEISFSTVPFIINIEGKEYIDDENLDILNLLEVMGNSKTASSSACPSPQAFADEFSDAEQVIAITISGNLSGSFASASAAKDMVLEKNPDKKICVLDSRSTGPETALCIKEMVNLIKSGETFDNVCKKAQSFLDEAHTAFALCSFDNLVKNGRMGKLSGFVARKLGMWGIGIASDEGTISMKGVSRGSKKAIGIILEYMADVGFNGGKVSISHCMNEEMQNALKTAILERWKGSDIIILNTRGLDSYYAERGGLIIAFK